MEKAALCQQIVQQFNNKVLKPASNSSIIISIIRERFIPVIAIAALTQII